ncbi:MAG: hypothetical protein AAGH42_03290 [Pseudomonadota bacterium]
MRYQGYIDSIKMLDLGFAGALALWGFRASAAGQSQCCAIVAGYERAFGRQSDDVLALMLDYAQILGNEGRRRIGLGRSGCGGITADELSIVATLASAQLSGQAATTAHLTWLLGKSPNPDHVSLVYALGQHFLRAGLVIALPDISVSDPAQEPETEAQITYIHPHVGTA